MPASSGSSQTEGISDSSQTKGAQSDQEGYTSLQKHAAFFDRNGDGLIYPWETYQGLRAIGAGFLQSAIGAVFLNMGLSQKTRPGKGFSLLFPIEVKNCRLGIHGSDTHAYDKDGRFVESKFEEMFKRHARTHQNALTAKEIKQLLKTNREPKDFAGWLSSYSVWKIMRELCHDKRGLLTKEMVRGVYDGSTFRKLEKQRSSSSSRENNI